jgi:hypothetical protein
LGKDTRPARICTEESHDATIVNNRVTEAGQCLSADRIPGLPPAVGVTAASMGVGDLYFQRTRPVSASMAVSQPPQLSFGSVRPNVCCRRPERRFHHFVSHPAKEEGVGLVEVLGPRDDASLRP